MTFIPTLHVTRLNHALAFYRDVLGFALNGRWPENGDPGYAALSFAGGELHLSSHSGDGIAGQAVLVLVDDLDGLFARFVQNGLQPGDPEDSPVHAGPLDQTWGDREVYVDDPDGNTLRFRQKKR